MMLLGLVILGAVFLIDTAYAQQERGIVIGQHYTQQQVDEFNFSGINLREGYESNQVRQVFILDSEPGGKGYDIRVEYPFYFDSLRKIADEKGNFLYYLGVRERAWNTYLAYGERKECEIRRSQQECSNNIRNRLIKEGSELTDYVRGWLKYQQTIIPDGRNWKDILP